MAEPKYTKGPWENVDDAYIEAANGTVVVNEMNTALPDEQITANAHLIAAAPELYEALEAMLRFGDIGSRAAAEIKAHAALAKARGER